MTVREVVLHHDVRASASLSLAVFDTRYGLRRALSTAVLLTLDLLAALGGALAATQLLAGETGSRVTGTVAIEALVACGAGLGAAVALRLYGLHYERHSLSRIVGATLAGLVAGLIAAAVLDGGVSTRGALMAWATALVLDLTLRAVYDGAVGFVMGPSGDAPPVVLIGRPDDLTSCAGLLGGGAVPQRVVGVVSDVDLSPRWQHASGLRALGGLGGLEHVLDVHQPRILVISNVESARPLMPDIIAACEQRHITLKVASTSLDFGRSPITFLPGIGTPMFVASSALTRRLSFACKRAGDILVASLALAALSPLLLAVGLAVRLTSPGPALFMDRRVGLGQRVFACYKFRTMVRDAAERQVELELLNEAAGAIFKIQDDPRVTRIGRFLRKTSIDELPQLINVVKGDMSIVGPRPLPLRDFDLMEDWHKRRHVVLPGITGLWQVSGRSDLGFDDMLALDDEYVATWSLTSDARILWRTLGVVFGRKGAY